MLLSLELCASSNITRVSIQDNGRKLHYRESPMRHFTLACAVSWIVLSILPGCASPQNVHFFPRWHPLFAGSDESGIRPGARPALAEAKADFELARHTKEPQFAQYAGTIPNTHSRIYQGKGYRLTMVRKDAWVSHSHGPEIILDATITGGNPFTYDEISEVQD
jgi:hypothetical protein